MIKPTKEGLCRLTGEYGTFVDSHILPKALTRPSLAGAPLMESTKGAGFKRRWKSWTDGSIVSREGEDILSRIDNAGIKELRKYQLIWSSWSIYRPYFEMVSPLFPGSGIRRVRFPDPAPLWVFFMSLLWRSAVSDNHAVEEIQLPQDRLESLKQYVLGNSTPVFSDFAVSLIQLLTQGEQHNHSPTLDQKKIPATHQSDEQIVRFARFYLDGLIVHIHLEPEAQKIGSETSIFLGSDETIISCVDYNKSSQHENLVLLTFESVFGPVK